MPRIYASDNDPHDYCKNHMPEEGSVTWHRLMNQGDGPDGRGNCFEAEADHPPYEDDDTGIYECMVCGKRLGEDDN